VTVVFLGAAKHRAGLIAAPKDGDGVLPHAGDLTIVQNANDEPVVALIRTAGQRFTQRPGAA
jgi:hypothetical protein